MKFINPKYHWFLALSLVLVFILMIYSNENWQVMSELPLLAKETRTQQDLSKLSPIINPSPASSEGTKQRFVDGYESFLNLPIVRNFPFAISFVLVVIIALMFSLIKLKNKTARVQRQSKIHEQSNCSVAIKSSTPPNDKDGITCANITTNDATMTTNHAFGNDRHGFEQVYWNLPGFQSLLRPFDQGISGRHFTPWEQFNANSKKQSQFLTNDFYRFHDGGSYLQAIGDIEAFIKQMLVELIEHLGPCSASVCLRDRRGDYYLSLQRSGNLFVSEKGTKLEGPFWNKLITMTKKGNYVLLGNGSELVFPLPSRIGSLGLLYFCFEEPLGDTKLIERGWREIQRYGETLLQACIYEQATVDLESTLYNGMRFQEDAQQELACYWQKAIPTNLVLLHLLSMDFPDTENLACICGKLLRHHFPFPQRSYRIGQNLYAVLTAQKPENEMDTILKEFQEDLQKRQYKGSLHCSQTVMNEEYNSLQVLFSKAQQCLQEL